MLWTLDSNTSNVNEEISIKGCNGVERSNVCVIKLIVAQEGDTEVDVTAFNKSFPAPSSSCFHNVNRVIKRGIAASCEEWRKMSKFLLGINHAAYFPVTIPVHRLPLGWLTRHPTLIPWCSRLTWKPLFKG